MHRTFLSAALFFVSTVIAQTNDTAACDSAYEIVITSTRYASLPGTTPGISYILNRHEIETTRPAAASDALGYVPGLDIEAGTGVGSPAKKTASINGTPAFHNIVLVDGKRLLSSHFHTGADIDLVPVDNIERIEVVKDASCALYGSDAIGGVINIITRKGGARPSLSFTAGGGTQNTFRTSLALDGAIDTAVSYRLFAGWDRSDGLPLAGGMRAGQLEFSQFSLMDRVEVKAGGHGAIGASVHYAAQNDLLWRGTKYDAWLFTPGVDLNMRLSEKLALSALAYYSQWNADLSTERNEIASPQVWLSWSGIRNNRITFGAEHAWRNFCRDGVPQKAQNYCAAFVQNEYTPLKTVRMLAAVRSDYVMNRSAGAENTGPVLSPKLSVLYRPLAMLGIRAGAGRGFRAPNVQELYESRYHPSGGGIWRYGDVSLKPEYSSNFNTGLDLSPLPGLSLLANGYYYDLADMISLVDAHRDTVFLNGGTPDTVPVLERRNINSFIIKSFEMGFRYRTRSLTFETAGSAVWQHSDDPEGSDALAFPGQNLRVKVTADLPAYRTAAARLFAGLRCSFNRKTPQGTVLDDYRNLEAGFSCSLMRRYELFLKGENLLGEEIDLYEDALFTVQGVRRFEGGLKISVY